MLEILYGPDGVGKSTIAEHLVGMQPGLVCLHGTNLASWFDNSPDMLRDLGFHQGMVPPDEAFADKIALINEASLALSSQVPVLIDGHALHKTAMNAVSGRIRLPEFNDSSVPSAAEVLGGSLRQFVTPLLGEAVTHTLVTLGDMAPSIEQAQLLQDRMCARGALSKWDPQTAGESLVQLTAAFDVQFILRDMGASVVERASQKPV